MEKTRLIYDNHGRPINYLRLAVTDRCNLRCYYCMPHEGIDWLNRKEILTYEELLRISSLLVKMGIEKIRITGGEPFVRKDIMQFLSALSKIEQLKKIAITTNGVLTAEFIPELIKLGINTVNLSIDSLDRNRFLSITRRDELPAVINTFEQLLKYNMDVSLNTVVMDGKNIQDIIPIVELTKHENITVRFIEEMPFNGSDNSFDGIVWNHVAIIQHIKNHFPEMYKIADSQNSTSYNYQIPQYKGKVGVIAAYTRSFCGTCNRIRITPQGMLKTCLYDAGVLNIRDLLRTEPNDSKIESEILNKIQQRHVDGREAEKNRSYINTINQSMASIGG